MQDPEAQLQVLRTCKRRARAKRRVHAKDTLLRKAHPYKKYSYKKRPKQLPSGISCLAAFFFSPPFFSFGRG